MDVAGVEMRMTSNPICQVGVHRRQINRQRAGDSGLGRFHLGPPCGDIYCPAGGATPAGVGAGDNGGQGRVKGFFAGQVPKDAGDGFEAAAEWGIPTLGKGFSGVMLKPFEEDEGDSAGRDVAGVGVLQQQGKKAGS